MNLPKHLQRWGKCPGSFLKKDFARDWFSDTLCARLVPVVQTGCVNGKLCAVENSVWNSCEALQVYQAAAASSYAVVGRLADAGRGTLELRA
jgi:hypothetical protein